MGQAVGKKRSIKLTEPGLKRLREGIRKENKKLGVERGIKQFALAMGIAENTLSSWLKGGQTYRNVLSRVFEDTVVGGLKDTDYEYVDTTSDSKRKDGKHTVKIPTKNNSALGYLSSSVPPLNRLFTGRADVLEKLHRNLRTENAVVALTGMAGIGKTETAITYAHRYRHDYSGIYWVGSESVEAIKSGLVALALQLDPPLSEAPEKFDPALQAVKNWFATHAGWLLILDNADDISLLSPFIPPQENGRLLLTTRAHAVARIAKSTSITPFSEEDVEDGATLLLRSAEVIQENDTLDAASAEDREAALAINQIMDGLPLALAWVGAFLLSEKCPVGYYLSLHKKYGITLAETVSSAGISLEPLSVSLLMNVAQTKAIPGIGPATGDFVYICAFLSPDTIPEAMFDTGELRLGEYANPLTEIDYLKVRAAVLAFSLMKMVNRDERANTNLLSIHRLVQDVIRETMGKEEQFDWATRTVFVVNAATPEPEIANWPLCGRLLPHWRSCAKHIDTYAINTAEASHLLDVAGSYLYENSHFEEAKFLLTQSLKIKEKIYKADLECLEMADGYNNLAAPYWRQGDYDRAETLYEHARKIREKLHPPDHPDIAEILNNLANLYLELERFDEAVPLLYKALTIRENESGGGDLHLETTLNGLAAAHHRQRQYEEALPFYQRALSVAEKKWGKEHLGVALPLINVAVLRNDMGQYGEAMIVLDRVLPILKENLEPTHPHMGGAIGQMAIVQWKQGQKELAREGFERALAIYEEKLGPKHRSTIRLRQKYAEFRAGTN